MQRYGIWLVCLLMLSGCGREAGNGSPVSADMPAEVTSAEVTSAEAASGEAESAEDTSEKATSSAAISAEVAPETVVPTTAAPTTVAMTDASPQSTDVLADREPVNEDCYEYITDIPAAEVERFAKQVKQQFMTRDWKALSENLAYPVTIGDAVYQSGEEFLAADFEEKLNPYFFVELKEESCSYMSGNQDGIMLGQTGRVWISEVLNEDLSSQGLKVIAINGLTESFGLPGGVKMKAAVDGVTASSLKLILENETDLNLIFGDDFKIKKYSYEDETWEDLQPLADDMPYNDIGYLPTRNQPVEWTADLSSRYGTLEDGHYAIVKTVLDADAPNGDGRYECAFAFTLSTPRGKN